LALSRRAWRCPASLRASLASGNQLLILPQVFQCWSLFRGWQTEDLSGSPRRKKNRGNRGSSLLGCGPRERGRDLRDQLRRIAQIQPTSCPSPSRPRWCRFRCREHPVP
jgi:hypothetical protein